MISVSSIQIKRLNFNTKWVAIPFNIFTVFRHCISLVIPLIKTLRIDNKPTPHGISVYPQSAAGVPFSTAYLQVKGDPITDLTEDLAAEQEGRIMQNIKSSLN